MTDPPFSRENRLREVSSGAPAFAAFTMLVLQSVVGSPGSGFGTGERTVRVTVRQATQSCLEQRHHIDLWLELGLPRVCCQLQRCEKHLPFHLSLLR